MKFEIVIDCVSGAFGAGAAGVIESDAKRNAEVSRILAHVGFMVNQGYGSGPVLDKDGERVGAWAFKRSRRATPAETVKPLISRGQRVARRQ